MTITRAEALHLAPQQDEYSIVGIGETAEYWVIRRKAKATRDEFDMPIPLIHKETGELTWTVYHLDFDLIDSAEGGEDA